MNVILQFTDPRMSLINRSFNKVRRNWPVGAGKRELQQFNSDN